MITGFRIKISERVRPELQSTQIGRKQHSTAHQSAAAQQLGNSTSQQEYSVSQSNPAVLCVSVIGGIWSAQDSISFTLFLTLPDLH